MGVSEEKVYQALAKVMIPGSEKNIVSLGMVKDVTMEDGEVSLSILLSAEAQSMQQDLMQACEKAVKEVEGVRRVVVRFPLVEQGGGQQQQVAQEEEILIPDVKNVILVGSGKGGVGKSTVALNLALAIKRKGARVGLMDADIYGPSIPTMLGAKNVKPTGDPETEKMRPIEIFGIKTISVGYLMDEGTPVIWRGPLLGSIITQFLGDVIWGELDYLIVDLPPGTGDVQLTFAQKISATGAVLVTTPQDVALSDVYRAKAMFDKVNIPTLGIIENMSAFKCPDCGAIHKIFPGEGAEKAGRELGIPVLGQIPMVMEISEGSDKGTPAMEIAPDSEYGQVFTKAANELSSAITKARAN